MTAETEDKGLSTFATIVLTALALLVFGYIIIVKIFGFGG